jgi:hypothetical protein
MSLQFTGLMLPPNAHGGKTGRQALRPNVRFPGHALERHRPYLFVDLKVRLKYASAGFQSSFCRVWQVASSLRHDKAKVQVYPCHFAGNAAPRLPTV